MCTQCSVDLVNASYKNAVTNWRDDVNIVQIVNIHARVVLITKRTKSERNGNSICFERLYNPGKARSNEAKILSNPMNWNFPKVVTRAKDKS